MDSGVIFFHSSLLFTLAGAQQPNGPMAQESKRREVQTVGPLLHQKIGGSPASPLLLLTQVLDGNIDNYCTAEPRCLAHVIQ